MNKCLIFAVLILVVCNGEPPTPILDAIISGASRIRDRIHNAGSLIGSLTHGHRGVLNIGGNFEINKGPPQHRPGPNGYGPGPNSNGPEPNGYGPGPNGYGPGPNSNGPGPNGYGPGPNGYGPGPNSNGPGPNGYGPDGPNGYGPRPNGYGPGPNSNGPGPNGYGPGPNGYGPGPNGNGPRPKYPGRPGYNQGPNNNNQYQNTGPNDGQNNQNYEYDKTQQNTVENTKQENMPNYNYANGNKKPSIDGQTLQGGTKHDDGPIRVPLNPNEVNYSGDKTENNAPKRETGKNNEAADDDQEFNIDIRSNDNE